MRKITNGNKKKMPNFRPELGKAGLFHLFQFFRFTLISLIKPISVTITCIKD